MEKNKVLRIISTVIDVLLVSIIVFIGYMQISMLVSKKNNHGVPQVFGQSILYVATNSMEDPNNPKSIDPGYGIVINKVKPQDIKPSTPIYGYDEGNNPITKPYEEHESPIDYLKDGNIVTFYYEKIKAPDTHRVVEVELIDGKYFFTTMGDNPIAHQKHTVEKWSQDELIGRVNSSSRALGQFLEISSPEAAAYLSARTGKNHNAWFFPVAIILPIVIIAVSYTVRYAVKMTKERRKRDAEIQLALEASGIDLNDEEACELFRQKEEMRLDIKEEMTKEYEKAKAKMVKELRKEQQNGKEN